MSTNWDAVIHPLIGRALYFDRQGNPISMRRWSELLEQGLDPDGGYGDGSYKRVAQDQVDDSWVSTVWLGIDHSCGLETHTPLIFETMIFGGRYADAQMHYCTEEDAARGHAEAVADLRAGLEPWWSYGEPDDGPST